MRWGVERGFATRDDGLDLDVGGTRAVDAGAAGAAGAPSAEGAEGDGEGRGVGVGIVLVDRAFGSATCRVTRTGGLLVEVSTILT